MELVTCKPSYLYRCGFPVIRAERYYVSDMECESGRNCIFLLRDRWIYYGKPDYASSDMEWAILIFIEIPACNPQLTVATVSPSIFGPKKSSFKLNHMIR